MRERPWRLLIESMLAATVLIVGLWVLGGAAERVSFHGDEGMNISTARYFGYLFVQRDLGRPEWGDNYWTHNHPRVMRYVLGGWLWARGYDLDGLPSPYDASNSFEENRRAGRVPDEALLIQARTPMVWLAAGAVVLLYLLGRALGGMAAGLVAALLALASPLAQTYLVRALPEAPLIFFLLLALLLGVLGARSGRGGLPLGWALALGVALGLGLGSKLTAILSLAAVAAWAALVTLLAAVQGADGRRRAWVVGRGWALALGVALAVFVATDPHLYPNPLLHIMHLFNHRAAESVGLQRVNPQFAIYHPLDRVAFVLRESLIGGTLTGSRGLPIEAPLAVVGTATLLATPWRGWRKTGQIPPEGLVVLTALAYFAGVSAFLALSLARYALPTLFLGTLLSGLGIAALGHQIATLSHRPTRRQSVVAGTAPRP